jgi:hypothetical protein
MSNGTRAAAEGRKANTVRELLHGLETCRAMIF